MGCANVLQEVHEVSSHCPKGTSLKRLKTICFRTSNLTWLAMLFTTVFTHQACDYMLRHGKTFLIYLNDVRPTIAPAFLIARDVFLTKVSTTTSLKLTRKFNTASFYFLSPALFEATAALTLLRTISSKCMLVSAWTSHHFIFNRKPFCLAQFSVAFLDRTPAFPVN